MLWKTRRKMQHELWKPNYYWNRLWHYKSIINLQRQQKWDVRYWFRWYISQCNDISNNISCKQIIFIKFINSSLNYRSVVDFSTYILQIKNSKKTSNLQNKQLILPHIKLLLELKNVTLPWFNATWIMFISLLNWLCLVIYGMGVRVHVHKFSVIIFLTRWEMKGGKKFRRTL